MFIHFVQVRNTFYQGTTDKITKIIFLNFLVYSLFRSVCIVVKMCHIL
jgi:hypothetical protein